MSSSDVRAGRIGWAATAVLALALSATAQRQFEELGRSHLPPDRHDSWSIILGDVDGDGDLDVVCGNAGTRNRLYLNDGDAVFSDVTETHLPVDDDYTSALAFIDVDRDGDLDLLCGTSGLAQARDRLYLNDGAGRFTDGSGGLIPNSSDPRTLAFAAGDVDGDGDIDVFCGTRHGNVLRINNGAGAFVRAGYPRVPSDRGSASVAMGDVDGDGDLDVVCGNSGQDRLYLNDGTGTFTDATSARMPVDSDDTSAVIFADVDGDGDPDIIAGNRRQRDRLYLNDGAGVFTDGTGLRMPADFEPTSALAAVDADGDGDLDLVCGSYGDRWTSAKNRLYLNDGTGAYTDVTGSRLPGDPGFALAVAAGDLDGDGRVDLVFANHRFAGRNTLLLNDGSGSFADLTATGLPSNPLDPIVATFGDVDGDGDLDVVLGNYGPSRIWINDGYGRFRDESQVRIPVAAHVTSSLAMGDVDGDGDLDCVLGQLQQNRLLLNDGAGHFTDVTGVRMPLDGEFTKAVVLGDVDGDADLDLICGNFTQRNRLYLNDGQGAFYDATSLKMPIESDETAALALGDVDGDGDLDLVCGNSGSTLAQNRLFLNDGSGTFVDRTLGRMPASRRPTRAVVLGDVDGDGDIDIVCGNGDERYVQSDELYLNDGFGFFADASANLPTRDETTVSLALGDVDLDGDLDLLCGIDGPGWLPNRLYLNDGTGRFSDVTGSRWSDEFENTSAVALGDVDGDGDLDALTANAAWTSKLRFNLLRQLHTPHAVRIGHDLHLDIHARYGPFRAADLAFPFLATAPASNPFPPFGTIRIDPNHVIPLPPVLVPQPQGSVRMTIPVPNDPTIVGGTLFGQALLMQYPVQTVLTNATGDVILR